VQRRIEGFNSGDPQPSPAEAPTAYDPSKQTRSAFAPPTTISSCAAQYTRLLEFQAAGCGPQFPMRFKVYQAPNRHPILAFCNAKSKMFFWDLARLTTYYEFMATLKDSAGSNSRPERPPYLQLKAPKKADKDSIPSLGASPDPDNVAPSTVYGPDIIAGWDSMYDISHPHNKPIKPHKTLSLGNDKVAFIGRQVAWSPDGDWCVAVGNLNRVLFFHRSVKDNLHTAG
jgi:polycomb protein EED